MKALQKLHKKYPGIYESITGKGLLIGQHFVSKDIGYKVSALAFHKGLLMAGTLNSAQTIRIEPPIVVTYQEIDKGLAILEEALSEVYCAINQKTQKKKKVFGIF